MPFTLSISAPQDAELITAVHLPWVAAGRRTTSEARARGKPAGGPRGTTCHLSCDYVPRPEESTTTVRSPRKDSSHSTVDARLDVTFNAPKPSVKFKFCSASRTAGLSGVKSRSNSGSFE